MPSSLYTHPQTNILHYSTDVNFIASQAIARSKQLSKETASEAAEQDEGSADAMAALERQARAPVGFVAASTGPEGGNRPQPASEGQPAQAAANPDAIDLDDEMDADEATAAV